MDPTLTKFAREFWDTTLEHLPIYATLVGDHRFDDRLGDISRDAEDRLRLALVDLRDRAADLDDASLAPADRVTRALLMSAIDDELAKVGGRDGGDVRLMELCAEHFRGPHVWLLQFIPQLTVTDPADADALLTRFAQVPRFLDQALGRFREALDAGRPPVRDNLQRAVGQVDAYLATPLDEDVFLSVTLPSGWVDAEGWRAPVRELARQVIRPAFRRYRDTLASELLPHGRAPEEAGVCHVADGAEIYATSVRLFTSLDLDPKEVHEYGRGEIEGRLAAEYRELGPSALGADADEAAIIARLRGDERLRYHDGEEMLADARVCLERAQTAAGAWFGRLPQAECVVAEVPAVLAEDHAAAYYIAPSDDGSRPGRYFLNVHRPELMLRCEAATTAFHEAIPGHHFQRAIQRELDQLPDFQRHLQNPAFAEGWALYSERLADEMDLYRSDLDRLGMVANDSFRAARLVVDTGLHALGWSRARAIDYMRDHVPLPSETIELEVDRYIAMPGQALAYKVGQRRLRRLREQAEDALGARFDVRAFHDTVLGSGAVTLPVVNDLVAEWARGVGDE